MESHSEKILSRKCIHEAEQTNGCLSTGVIRDNVGLNGFCPPTLGGSSPEWQRFRGDWILRKGTDELYAVHSALSPVEMLATNSGSCSIPA